MSLQYCRSDRFVLWMQKGYRASAKRTKRARTCRCVGRLSRCASKNAFHKVVAVMRTDLILQEWTFVSWNDWFEYVRESTMREFRWQPRHGTKSRRDGLIAVTGWNSQLQLLRSSITAFEGSSLRKMAVPATRTLAPARTTKGAVSVSIPPSTSI
jgi:hypothetical protein